MAGRPLPVGRIPRQSIKQQVVEAEESDAERHVAPKALLELFTQKKSGTSWLQKAKVQYKPALTFDLDHPGLSSQVALLHDQRCTPNFVANFVLAIQDSM